MASLPLDHSSPSTTPPPRLLASLSNEILTFIALELDGGDLCSFLLVNKKLWSRYSDPSFWKNKLEISDNTGTMWESSRRCLFRCYFRKCRAVESIEGKRIPTSVEEFAEARGTIYTDKIYASPFEGGLAFFCRTERCFEEVTTTVYDLQSTYVFKVQGFFQLDEFFDCGRFCLGVANETQVVYRVQDWSLWAKLKTDATWAALGADSDLLLCIHTEGVSAGKVEVWNSTADTRQGKIQCSGISTLFSLPRSKQFLTLNENGDGRIWDMYHPRYSIDIDPGFEAVYCHGNILELAEIDGHRKTKYCHLHNKSLPLRLQGISTKPDFWVTFSDGTYVLGDEDIGGHSCHFWIFSPEGNEQGSFQHDSTKSIMVFMDRYIVTVTFAGDLIIWDKLGVKWFTTHLGYCSAKLVEGEVGSLFAFDFHRRSVRKMRRWDFTEPHHKDTNLDNRSVKPVAGEVGSHFAFARRMIEPDFTEPRNMDKKSAYSPMLELWLS